MNFLKNQCLGIALGAVCVLLYCNSAFAQFSIAETNQLEKKITGKATFFAELIPSESDNNNLVDQYLILSEGEPTEEDYYSVAIRFSAMSYHIDAADGEEFVRTEEAKIPFEIDQVYQCWIDVDVVNNTYSLYGKEEGGQMLALKKDAAFRRPAKSLTHWAKTQYGSDTLEVNAFTQVNSVGEWPGGYVPSKSKPVFYIKDQVIPENATVIDNPKSGARKGPMDLKKIVLTEDATELYFHTAYVPGRWIKIPSGTFIMEEGSEEKLLIKECVGMPIDVEHFTTSSGFHEYKLVFPPLSKDATSFDYGEPNNGPHWFMLDIRVVPKPSKVPSTLAGNWFDSDNGEWRLSLLEDAAVYKNQVWNYADNLADDKSGEIHLKRNDETLALNYKLIKDGKIKITEEGIQYLLSQEARYDNVPNPINPPAFSEPFFSLDTAVFSGYYHGYTTKFGVSTMMVYVNNILTGQQNSHLVKIKEDGTFSVKIPLIHAEEVYVRSEIGNSRMFLEPGKEVFVMMDLTETGSPLVMGANARLISELMSNELSDGFNISDYLSIYNVILDMSAKDFRAYSMDQRDKDLKKLEDLYNSGKVSDRFHQMMKNTFQAGFPRNVLHYHWNSESAYRRKHNVPRDQRELPVSFEVPSEASFYNFINPEFVNAPEAVISGDYNNFINAFKFSPLLQASRNFNTLNMIVKLNQKGVLDEKYDSLASRIATINDDYHEMNKQHEAKYSSIRNKIINENLPLFQELMDKKEGDPLLSFLETLNAQGKLSKEGKDLYEATMEYRSTPIVMEVDELISQNLEIINGLWQDYGSYISLETSEKREKFLLDSLGIEKGLCTDIMFAQDILSKVSEEYSPLSDELLQASVERVQTPFIADYIRQMNELAIKQIEINNSKGIVANEVPSEGDNVFEAITGKYKGKVLYLDFWATWCGPCRSSMKRQKGMKEELEGEDIVFVYITNPSSPEKTYENMIPDIKGEHYRVSQDEWNFLSEKFGISGIPHYVIVNKEGLVVNDNAPREPSRLKGIFSDLLKD